jgi:Family of unknown function (DUF6029)
MKKGFILFSILFLSQYIFAQGTLSGDLMVNQNFFIRDTNIKASGNPLYNNYLSGSEDWLGLRYNVNGYTFSLRGNVFNNSNLNDPTNALSGFGVGAWSIAKDMNDLNITLGYIYDQVGSGILFRAYEDRGLLIDNALVGLELKYKVSENLSVKAFTGQQKHLFDKYAPVIKGVNIENDASAGQFHFFTGAGILNRTLDQMSINQVASVIQGYDTTKRFEPQYNVYAFTLYNTLTYKNFSWYAEAAYKTHEAIKDLEGNLTDVAGNIEYTTLSYGRKGIAVNLSGKRTENFVMLTSPNETGIPNSGMLNWQPVVAVLRPERLMSLYTPASQNISEMAATANVVLSPTDVTNFNITATHINTLANTELYRELYADFNYSGMEKWKFQGGLQYVEYNQTMYQVIQLHEPIIYALSPFAEITRKLNGTQSLRFEGSFTYTKQYYGSWLFGLLEYTFAPKYSISVSDMYNYAPNTGEGNPLASTASNHYYNIFASYTKGSNRFSLAFVKQVAGINCSGGVCRYEPAFSGLRATLTSSF